MTIIDELLILLDDLEEAEAEEIPHYFNGPNLQVIFSSLGRLINRGWASKKIKRQETYYTITTHGINELNKTLDTVKRDGLPQWDHRWHLVIFDIPESKRKLRDNFRLLLKEQGYGILKSSVWISPWHNGSQVKRFAKRHNLVDHIFEIETSVENNNYQASMLARHSWDWQAIEKQYRNFLTAAEKGRRELSRQPLPIRRFLAKKLVFQYAEVVRQDPQLPYEVAPNATLSRRAHELYVKIRPYCLDRS